MSKNTEYKPISNPLAGSSRQLSSSPGNAMTTNMARNQTHFPPVSTFSTAQELPFDPNDTLDPTSFSIPNSNISLQDVALASNGSYAFAQEQLAQPTWNTFQNAPDFNGFNNPLFSVSGPSSISGPTITSQTWMFSSDPTSASRPPASRPPASRPPASSFDVNSQWVSASQPPVSRQSTNFGDMRPYLMPAVASQPQPIMPALALPPSRVPRAGPSRRPPLHRTTKTSAFQRGSGYILPARRPKTLTEAAVSEGEIIDLPIMKDKNGQEIHCRARCSLKQPQTFVDLEFARKIGIKDRPIPPLKRRQQETPAGVQETKRFCEFYVPLKVGSVKLPKLLSPQLCRLPNKDVQIELGENALIKLGLISIREGTSKPLSVHFQLGHSLTHKPNYAGVEEMLLSVPECLPASGMTSAEATTPSTQLSSTFGDQGSFSKQPSEESGWMVETSPSGEASSSYVQAPSQGQ